MSSFKEYNNNTFYIGPNGTNRGKELEWDDFLRIGYATYPFDNNSGGDLIWFGLKQGDNFEGVLKQNIDYSNGLKFTSSHSDCQAMIKSYNPAFSPQPNTGMQPLFLIGKSDVYREITFKWKDFVVFKFIQYGPNKLLICKPTWTTSPDSVSNKNIIGFSTSNTKISSDVFYDYAGPGYTKYLCATEQLNYPHNTNWLSQPIKNISALKYIEGINLQNEYPDYYLIDIIVYDSNNETIIKNDFDKIANIGLLYIFTITSSGMKNIGYVTMSKGGTYMLAKIY